MSDKELQDRLEGLFSDFDMPIEDLFEEESDSAYGSAPKNENPNHPHPPPAATPAPESGEGWGGGLFSEEPSDLEPAPAKSEPEPAVKRPRQLPAPYLPPETTQAIDYEAYRSRPQVNWRLIIWSVLVTLAVLLLVAYWQAIFGPDEPAEPVGGGAPRFVIPLTPTASSTPTATATRQPGGGLSFSEPTLTPTPVAGGRITVLTPAEGEAGWLGSSPDEFLRPNHFGESFLYAGAYEGQIYRAAFRFDLSNIPRGSTIHAASLRLTGLRADQLAQMGNWRLHMLPPDMDYHWPAVDYKQINQAVPWSSFEPVLKPDDLGIDRLNQFEFSEAQRQVLEQRLLAGSDRAGTYVTFRIDGPTEGDNLFAWDSGSGPASQGAGPELFLSLGPAPAETVPARLVVVTSTPTPESVLTAVVMSARQTVEATRSGTPTPLPPSWVTPLVVTATPTPENTATAQLMEAMATAVAMTTGQPPNLEVVTATPTPRFVIITSTPTPLMVETAVAQALQQTAVASRNGPATPFPEHWVTPLVVTSTPSPANTATVTYLRAIALTTGTPTPLPGNAQTATATPVSIAAAPLASPTATATPSPTPQAIPASLLGKILFLSDREGATAEERLRADRLQVTPQVTPQPYAYDPATGQLERLTALWPYQVAATRQAWTADNRFETYTKELLWTNVMESRGNSEVRVATEVLAIHYYDHLYDVEAQVSRMGAGIAYDPVWSPTRDEIAFVSTESGNDEIWTINRDGSQARQLTRNEWEWDKHPAWSPDGERIVFFSNRTGNNQLWIMNRDGSDQQLLMEFTPYNDLYPVWVKVLEPPPPLQRQPDWRFVKPEGEP